MLRLTTAAAAVALTLGTLSVPTPAYADYNTVPLGCDARPLPWQRLAVFSTQNPNAASTEIDLGSDNLVLEPPNVRAGQPSTFLPGFTEGIFAAQHGAEFGSIHWYLL